MYIFYALIFSTVEGGLVSISTILRKVCSKQARVHVRKHFDLRFESFRDLRSVRKMLEENSFDSSVKRCARYGDAKTRVSWNRTLQFSPIPPLSEWRLFVTTRSVVKPSKRFLRFQIVLFESRTRRPIGTMYREASWKFHFQANAVRKDSRPWGYRQAVFTSVWTTAPKNCSIVGAA